MINIQSLIFIEGFQGIENLNDVRIIGNAQILPILRECNHLGLKPSIDISLKQLIVNSAIDLNMSVFYYHCEIEVISGERNRENLVRLLHVELFTPLASDEKAERKDEKRE